MLASSKEGLRAFEEMLRGACVLVRPPEKLDVAEWADKYGMLSAEGSSQPGKWYTSNAEYQREPMQALCDAKIQTEVLMWASQVGKTQIALFLAAYHMHHDPAPILFIEPDETLAKVISTDRIGPMIRDTPALQPLFAAARTRGGGNDTLHKSFPGGHLTLGWASSPAQLASRPIRILITDEEGRYEAAVNREGDPVDQARKRLATFRANRKHLRVSSPALRRTCRITKAFEESDQRRYYVPCPHCGHRQTLRWPQIKWEPGKPESVRYICEANSCEIFEADKQAMVRHGEWRAENPGGGDGRTAGFHLNALYSTIGYEWHEIVAEFEKCQGIPDKLQVFTNTVLAEAWDEQAEGADLNEIQKRVEPYAAPAPAWVVLVTCGVDVQPDRIEGTKWGFGLNEVSGVLEHKTFWGDTSDGKRGAWVEFDRWRRDRVQHESGLDLPVTITFIDSGDGNRAQAVYDYCRWREAEKVFACKGSSQSAAPIVNEAKRVGRQKVLLVMVGSSTAKDLIFSRLKIADATRAGYIHFPQEIEAGCNKEYFEHLTAEALVTKTTRTGEKSSWQKLKRRNEALDCAVYAWAARTFTRVRLPQLARQLAARAAKVSPELLEARRLEWAQRDAAETTPPPSSSVSSPASLSPARPRRKRPVLRRPRADWIRQPLG